MALPAKAAAHSGSVWSSGTHRRSSPICKLRTFREREMSARTRQSRQQQSKEFESLHSHVSVGAQLNFVQDVRAARIVRRDLCARRSPLGSQLGLRVGRKISAKPAGAFRNLIEVRVKDKIFRDWLLGYSSFDYNGLLNYSGTRAVSCVCSRVSSL